MVRSIEDFIDKITVITHHSTTTDYQTKVKIKTIQNENKNTSFENNLNDAFYDNIVRILLRKMKCYNCSELIQTTESIILSTLKNRATTETIPIDSAFLVNSMNDTIIINNHLLSGNSLNLSNEIVIIRRFGSDLDILTVLIIALMFIFCTFSICASLENCITPKQVFI
jgi:hypothetical protein